MAKLKQTGIENIKSDLVDNNDRALLKYNKFPKFDHQNGTYIEETIPNDKKKTDVLQKV